jgi:hypothetical protein
MTHVLKNPFFLAILAAVLLGSACGLLVAPDTSDVGQIFVVAGAFMLFAIIPTMIVAFVVTASLKQNERFKAEQASVPKEVLSNRYMNQMLWSLAGATAGILITAATYLLAQNQAGGTYVICTGAIVFGVLSFLQGLLGWLRNK